MMRERYRPTHAVTNDVVQNFSMRGSDEAWIVL